MNYMKNTCDWNPNVYALKKKIVVRSNASYGSNGSNRSAGTFIPALKKCKNYFTVGKLLFLKEIEYLVSITL